MSSEEGEPGSEQQQADAHEAPSGPTIATFASEWLGYAEVNIANDVRWYSNFPYLCLALLAAVVLLLLWWKQVTSFWWGLPIWVIKVPLSVLGGWSYLRWASPLQYESIAIKRSVGVEVCTRWKLFEESYIVPFTSLTAVVMHLVADEEFRLVVKARGDKAYTCFANLRPDFLTLVQSYTDLAAVLPRNVRKGQVAAIEPAPLAGYKLGRWWLRQVHFTRAGAACLWRHGRRWWRAGYYWCLRVFAPQQRHQQQQQQRQRAQARRGSGSSGGGAQPRGGGTPEATHSSGGEEEPGRHQGQPSSAGPTGQPPGGQRAPEAPAQKPKGKGKGKGRKR